jgi:hypothetical protein
MSVKKKSIEYAAVAIVVSLAIIAASIFYMGFPVPSGQSSNSSNSSNSIQGGKSAALSIRLTDPPQVPSLTTSLNLTYSSLSLLVGEPTGTGGKLNTTSATITPIGGSATIDLLKLQNTSQTIAVASLPNDSILYSVTFTVTSIKIDVNNTISTVALATGGSTFEVTISQPSGCRSGDYALLQLNPVVVNTPSGYQLIPSSVGVMGHGASSDEVGEWHPLGGGEFHNVGNAHGNVSASIVTLSVNANVTTLTVLVNNSASFPVNLMALGIHGNFTVIGSVCQGFGRSMPYGQMGGTGNQHDTTTTGHGPDHPETCIIPLHMDELVFVPVPPSSTATTTTQTSTSCATGQMNLVNGLGVMEGFGPRSLTIKAGQCIELTFVGKLTFGNSNFILVPSTSAGQVYVLHVIATNGANQLVSCSLPLGASSCKALQPQQDSQDW